MLQIRSHQGHIRQVGVGSCKAEEEGLRDLDTGIQTSLLSAQLTIGHDLPHRLEWNTSGSMCKEISEIPVAKYQKYSKY